MCGVRGRVLFLYWGLLPPLWAFHYQCMPQTHHVVCVVNLMRPLCVHLFHVVNPLARPPGALAVPIRVLYCRWSICPTWCRI